MFSPKDGIKHVAIFPQFFILTFFFFPLLTQISFSRFTSHCVWQTVSHSCSNTGLRKSTSLETKRLKEATTSKYLKMDELSVTYLISVVCCWLSSCYHCMFLALRSHRCQPSRHAEASARAVGKEMIIFLLPPVFIPSGLFKWRKWAWSRGMRARKVGFLSVGRTLKLRCMAGWGFRSHYAKLGGRFDVASGLSD